MEVILHAFKSSENCLEMCDKDRHVGASKLVLVFHVVLLNRRINLFLQHSNLVQFEILQCLLQNILKSILALLHQLAQRFFRFVALWIDDLDWVSVYLGVPEFDLALVNCKLDDVVAKRVISVVAWINSFLHLQLVIVEELFEEARFWVLVELWAYQATRAVPCTLLAGGVYLDLLFSYLVHPLIATALIAWALSVWLGPSYWTELRVLHISILRVDHHGLGLLASPYIISLLLNIGCLHLVHLRFDGYLDLAVAMINFLRMLEFLQVALIALYSRRLCKLFQVLSKCLIVSLLAVVSNILSAERKNRIFGDPAHFIEFGLNVFLIDL